METIDIHSTKSNKVVLHILSCNDCYVWQSSLHCIFKITYNKYLENASVSKVKSSWSAPLYIKLIHIYIERADQKLLTWKMCTSLPLKSSFCSGLHHAFDENFKDQHMLKYVPILRVSFITLNAFFSLSTISLQWSQW